MKKKKISKINTQDLLNNYNLGILTALVHKSIFVKKSLIIN